MREHSAHTHRIQGCNNGSDAVGGNLSRSHLIKYYVYRPGFRHIGKACLLDVQGFWTVCEAWEMATTGQSDLFNSISIFDIGMLHGN